MITVTKADHHHGSIHALRGVTFNWDVGVTVLLGPNGAGKTTLCRGLVGDLELDALELVLPPRDSRAVDRNVGYLPQDPRLIESFTCLEYLLYCGWLRGLDRKDAKTEAEDGLQLVGLVDRSASKVRSLSGGMKRRLAIAGAFAGISTALVLDEPMSGLDPLQRAEMRSLIAELGKRMPVLLATHVLQDLPEVADRVVMLSGGQVLRDGNYWEFADVEPGVEVSTQHLEQQYRNYLGASG